jgi:hypothetical protein
MHVAMVTGLPPEKKWMIKVLMGLMVVMARSNGSLRRTLAQL